MTTDQGAWRIVLPPLLAYKGRMGNDNAPTDDDLRPEYDSSILKGGARGKYLERYRAGTNLALLASDVRAAFPTDEAVNDALRSLLQGRQPAQG